MWPELALGLCLSGVIDQLDGDVAALESPSLDLIFLSVSALPEDTREGDPVTVYIRRKHLRPGRSRRAFLTMTRSISGRTSSDRRSCSRRAQ